MVSAAFLPQGLDGFQSLGEQRNLKKCRWQERFSVAELNQSHKREWSRNVSSLLPKPHNQLQKTSD